MGVGSGAAVDLGTVNFLVHVLGHGLVVDEPSGIAVHRPSGKVVGVGFAADRLAGREPAGVEVLHPPRDGVVSDLRAATEMLRTFLHRAIPRKRLAATGGPVRPERCHGGRATGARRRSCVRPPAPRRPPGRRAGGHRAERGRRPGSADGRFVLDVGGGTTEAAVVAGARMVAFRSLRLGGNAMDEAVGRAVRASRGCGSGTRKPNGSRSSWG